MCYSTNGPREDSIGHLVHFNAVYLFESCVPQEARVIIASVLQSSLTVLAPFEAREISASMIQSDRGRVHLADCACPFWKLLRSVQACFGPAVSLFYYLLTVLAPFEAREISASMIQSGRGRVRLADCACPFWKIL